ncbi:hypothetical protein DFP72DRAFT_1086893, partial [Ephemerocybe angulata]
ATVPRSQRFNPTAAPAASRPILRHKCSASQSNDESEDEDEENQPTLSLVIATTHTIRKQRIESEQGRRDELRDGYARLKDTLPPSNRKSSKVSLLERGTYWPHPLSRTVKEQLELTRRLKSAKAEVHGLRNVNEALMMALPLSVSKDLAVGHTERQRCAFSLLTIRHQKPSRPDEVATPKKVTPGNALPTLTELLSSTKKARTLKRKQLRRKEPQSIPGLRHRPPSPQVQEIPRNPSPAEFEIEQSISWKADLNLLLPPTDYSILNFNAEHTHTHDAESGMGQLDGLKMNPYAAGSVYDDLDLASPAKSLSSLAGSHIESSGPPYTALAATTTSSGVNTTRAALVQQQTRGAAQGSSVKIELVGVRRESQPPCYTRRTECTRAAARRLKQPKY